LHLLQSRDSSPTESPSGAARCRQR
jgi:hypothetical protein